MRTTTRAQALGLAGGAALGAGALAAGLARPDAARSTASRATDVRILNALLVLEDVQAVFYETALRGGALRGDLLTYARTVAPQEREHAAALRAMLGGEAGGPPRVRARPFVASAARFHRTAIDLEEAVIAAYVGQGANLTPAATRDAARIVAVEARHAAWIRDLAGDVPAPNAADPARPLEDVLAGLRRQGLLA
jgi:hypothetical protein